MPQWLEKIRDYFIGALGGFCSGVVTNTFVQSLVFQVFGYQEGWYRQFAPFFPAPFIVLILYVAGLAASDSKRRFLIAGLLIVPVFVIYLSSRIFLPLTERYAWIEITSLLTMVAQFAGIFVVGSWVLFWLSYDRMQVTSQAPQS